MPIAPARFPNVERPVSISGPISGGCIEVVQHIVNRTGGASAHSIVRHFFQHRKTKI